MANWFKAGPKRRFDIQLIIQKSFQTAGGLWALLEVVSFIPKVKGALVNHEGWILLSMIVISLIAGFAMGHKVLQREFKIANTDIRISLEVANLLDYLPSTSIVVATNRTFDTTTTNNFISPNSLQGQVCTKLFDGDTKLMGERLRLSLSDIPEFRKIDDDRQTNTLEYSVGTTVLLEVKTCKVYLLGLTQMSKAGRSSASFEDVQVALASLWEYVRNHGDIGDMAIPLLGMGHGRVDATKAAVIQAIALSFIAAVTQGNKRFCNKLRIVIHESDYKKGDCDLDELAEYIRTFCRIVGSPVAGVNHAGKAIE